MQPEAPKHPWNRYILNTGTRKPSIVLGISGKVNELVDLDRCMIDDIPLIRRFSGGGTVIVDDSTLFATFVLNDKDINTKPYPREIMDWTQKVHIAFDLLQSIPLFFHVLSHLLLIYNVNSTGISCSLIHLLVTLRRFTVQCLTKSLRVRTNSNLERMTM